MYLNFHLFLRISQFLFSSTALVLSSHLAFWKTASVHEISIQVYFLSFLSCVSVIEALVVELATRSPLKGTHPYTGFYTQMYTIFSIDFVIALSYMAGFIALFSSTQVRLCHGVICALARVDTVFAALNYVVWTASSVRSGCDILEFTHKLKLIEDVSEKGIA